MSRSTWKSHITKVFHNSKRRPAMFKVGDTVWRRNKFLSNASQKFMAKLAPKYDKAIITDILSNNSYRLSNTFGKKLGVWHAKDLKPYQTSTKKNRLTIFFS